MLEYMSAYNSRDPISLPINSDTRFSNSMYSLKGYRIAMTYDFDLFNTVDARITAKLDNMVRVLSDAGADLHYVHFNFKHSLPEFLECWLTSISIDTALDLYNWKQRGLDLIRDHREELSEDWIKYNQRAYNWDIHDFREFNEIRTDILDAHEDIFENYDIIISPTTVCLPPENHTDGTETLGPTHVGSIELYDNRIGFAETFLVNFVGYPAASVPMGMIDGLPVGMQVIGRKYQDVDVFSVSRVIEDCCPWKDNYKFSSL